MALPTRPGPRSTNDLLLAELRDAEADAERIEARAQMARAKVAAVRAKITAAGKDVTYDYKDGRTIVRVVDLA